MDEVEAAFVEAEGGEVGEEEGSHRMKKDHLNLL